MANVSERDWEKRQGPELEVQTQFSREPNRADSKKRLLLADFSKKFRTDGSRIPKSGQRAAASALVFLWTNRRIPKFPGQHHVSSVPLRMLWYTSLTGHLSGQAQLFTKKLQSCGLPPV